MKLYYSPGACSLAAHIVLNEAGLNFILEKVDLKTKTTESGQDFNLVTSKGYVPALQLDNGVVLTEGVAILQHLADCVPEKNLAPKQTSFERVELWEWLNYIATEVHKSFSPVFGASRMVENSEAVEQLKVFAKNNLSKKMDFLSNHLTENQFVMGKHFTVADAYLFTVLRWLPVSKLSLDVWPSLKNYFETVASRPQVHSTLLAEGLVKK